MAARGDTGLADEQVVQLRNQVTAGGRPRVRVSGPQFPAGTTGTVLRVGDPGTDGSDFVTVRVKVGGVTDELQFAPTELATAGRGRAAAPRVVTEPAKAAKPVKAATSPRSARRAAASRPQAAATEPVRPSAPARAKAPGPSRRAASVPTVTVTIASAGSSWSVTAQRGARTVVKKAPLPPGVVAAIAALLDQPGIDEAVAAVNDTAREEAEARAATLRAELAEVEAVLISHRRP